METFNTPPPTRGRKSKTAASAAKPVNTSSGREDKLLLRDFVVHPKGPNIRGPVEQKVTFVVSPKPNTIYNRSNRERCVTLPCAEQSRKPAKRRSKEKVFIAVDKPRRDFGLQKPDNFSRALMNQHLHGSVPRHEIQTKRFAKKLLVEHKDTRLDKEPHEIKKEEKEKDCKRKRVRSARARPQGCIEPEGGLLPKPKVEITTDSHVNGIMDRFLNIFESMNGSISSFGQNMINQSQNWQDMLSGSSDMIFKSLIGVGGIVVICHCFRNRVSFKEVIALVGFVALLLPERIRKRIVGPLQRVVKHYFNANGATIEPQSDLFGSVPTSAVSELLVSVLGAFHVFKTPKHKMREFNNIFAKTTQSAKGLEVAIEHIFKFLQSVVKFVTKEDLEFLKASDREVRDWMEDCKVVVKKAESDELLTTFDNSRLVFALRERGRVLMSNLSRFDNESVRVLNTWLHAIEPVCKIFEDANFSPDTRPEPLSILFRGESGVGKSYASMPFVSGILTRTLSCERLKEFRRSSKGFIYSRQFEHGYWDGYNGQEVCVFDDFGQATDVAGEPDNEYMNMIRCTNIFPNSLHMAHLSDKGKTNFTSSIIFATTNMFKFNLLSINQPEAVLRRFAMVVDVYPKTEFCKDGTEGSDLRKRRLDPSKITKSFDKNVWEFHLMELKMDNGVPNYYRKAIHTYDSLMDLAVATYNKKMDESDGYKAEIDRERLAEIDARIAKLESEAVETSDEPVACVEDSPGLASDDEDSNGVPSIIERFDRVESPVITEQAGLNCSSTATEFLPARLLYSLRAFMDAPVDFCSPRFLEVNFISLWDRRTLVSGFNSQVIRGFHTLSDDDWSELLAFDFPPGDVSDLPRVLVSDLIDVVRRDLPDASREATIHFYGRLGRVHQYLNGCFNAEGMARLTQLCTSSCSALNIVILGFIVASDDDDFSNFFPVVEAQGGLNVDPSLALNGLPANSVVRKAVNILDGQGKLNGTNLRRLLLLQLTIEVDKSFENKLIRQIRDLKKRPAEADPADGVAGIVALMIDSLDDVQFLKFAKDGVAGACLAMTADIADSQQSLISETANRERPIPKLYRDTQKRLDSHPVQVQDSRFKSLLAPLKASMYAANQLIDHYKKSPFYLLLDVFEHATVFFAGMKIVGAVRGIFGGSSVEEKRRKRGLVHPEGMIDPMSMEIQRKILKSSTFIMYQDEEARKSGKRAGVVTLVKGRVAITTQHYLDHFMALVESGRMDIDDEFLLVKYGHPDIKYPVKVSDFLTKCIKTEGEEEDTRRDIVYFEIPDLVNKGPDLTKFFVSEDDFTRRRDLRGYLTVPQHDNTNLTHSITCNRIGTHINVRKTERDSGYNKLTDVVSYKCPTTRGDCGSLCYISDPSTGSAKIFGMHCAGQNNDTGYGALIYREDIEMALEFFEPQIIDEEYFPYPESNLPIGGNCVVLKKSELSHSLYSKSSIVKSELYEQWGENKRVPAVLCPVKRDVPNEGTVTLDPRALAVSRYSNSPPRLDKELVRRVVSHYSSYIVSTNVAHSRRVLDFDEAVVGVDGDDFRNAIPRSTSSGYPYALDVRRFGKKKFGFFGDSDCYDLSGELCEVLRQEVACIIESAKHGFRKLHVYLDVLKDERRSQSKIENVDTRLVSACPLPLLVAIRMYFMDFSVAIMESRILNGCAVGVNPFSHEWDFLGRNLQSKGRHCIAGDFKSYDSNQVVEVLNGVLQIINDWYADGEENAKIRTVLWQEIINSRHLYGDTIYEWNHSLPSGNPLTTIINSLYNGIIFRMAWVAAHPGDRHALSRFEENVYLVAYGDDNVLNVSEESIGIFNQNTLPGLMLDHCGMIYTDENKSTGVIPDSRPLSAVTFLKRGWRYCSLTKRYVAPLALDTIKEAPYWTKKGPDMYVNTKDTFDSMFGELSLHGEQIFSRESGPMLLAARNKLNHRPKEVYWPAVVLDTLSREHNF